MSQCQSPKRRSHDQLVGRNCVYHSCLSQPSLSGTKLGSRFWVNNMTGLEWLFAVDKGRKKISFDIKFLKRAVSFVSYSPPDLPWVLRRWGAFLHTSVSIAGDSDEQSILKQMSPRLPHQTDHRAQPLRVRALPVSDHMNFKELSGVESILSHVHPLRPDLLSHFLCVDLILLF